MGEWIATHWVDLIQSAGIAVAIVLNVSGRWEDKKTRQLKNLADLIEKHRALWRDYEQDSELWRIKRKEVNLRDEPMTQKEATFVRSVITHLFGAYEAICLKEIAGLEKLADDAGGFLSLPIPNAVWAEVKNLQDEKFIRFVESALDAVLPGTGIAPGPGGVDRS